MGKIININNLMEEITDSDLNNSKENLIGITDGMIREAQSDILNKTSFSMPITQLATLGAGVSSLLPQVRTVTQTSNVNMQDLYQLANKSVGDTLKQAKDGTKWGAFHTADRKSKFVKLKEVGYVSIENKTVMPINPETMIMAVALFSIEKELGNIAKTTKDVQTFLQVEKESEIEADADTLALIISKYKHNWDNEQFITSNHKMVLDVQRTSKKHIISYQKKIDESLKIKHMILAQSKVNDKLDNLLKKFRYYRLSLYTYAMASFEEIILSGNFKKESIVIIVEDINKRSIDYRELYAKCSLYLEKMLGVTIERNVLKGLGTASMTIGKLIGNVPVIKEGIVDEFLEDSGKKLEKNACSIKEKTIKAFAEISDPCTGIFLEKMDVLQKIYNDTTDICFDKENIYLISG
ncbi:MAG: hypothetical protein PHD70_10900 [Anaerostipes sp.]|jgi:hypothetical protein|nr:hypothetical protein [Anaerostipes sp.]